jgi:hypothetical protein
MKSELFNTHHTLSRPQQPLQFETAPHIPEAFYPLPAVRINMLSEQIQTWRTSYPESTRSQLRGFSERQVASKSRQQLKLY